MPIRVILKREIVLSDYWGGEDEVNELSLQDWCGIFAEDIVGFLDDIGGIDGLVTGVVWEESDAN